MPRVPSDILIEGLPPGGAVGIDPGRTSGGIAYVWKGGGIACKMPETDHDIWETIQRLRRLTDTATLEKVHSMPGQGVASTFKFGTSYGELKMALVAGGFVHDLVTPRKWQQKMQCLSGGDKNITKQAAQRLFPNLTITHAIADALLIAEYSRRLHLEL